jgi:hypothetical protein
MPHTDTHHKLLHVNLPTPYFSENCCIYFNSGFYNIKTSSRKFAL